MKKIALFLSLAAMVASCKNLAENEYEVTGTIKDPAFEGKNVFLEKQGGMMGFTAIDTVKVKNGKFVFKDTIKAPSFYYISLEGKANDKVNFILEPGAIDIDVDKDTLYKSKTGGTYNNEKLQDFKKISFTINNKMKKFEKDNLPKRNEALKNNDTVTVNKLGKERTEIIKNYEKDLKSFIKSNPKAYVDLMALGQIAQLGFTDMDDVKKIFQSLDPSLKNTKEGKQITDYFAKMADSKKAEAQPQPQAAAGGVKVGDAAPQFAAPAPDGKTVALKEAMGKLTLVDFWASWCQPCRKENPNVVALYKEFHAKGLNIIGVSLDKEAALWKKAIAADKLEWTQVSNLKFWDDPIAKQYGVEQIPTSFLLDATGKVIAKDLRGDELKAKVAELLK